MNPKKVNKRVRNQADETRDKKNERLDQRSNERIVSLMKIVCLWKSNHRFVNSNSHFIRSNSKNHRNYFARHGQLGSGRWLFNFARTDSIDLIICK